ncbi:proteophosphoglycan 5 [Moniliophthora roreri]|uniref:Proteophosphoglycan 5 n=1 Tax=Moniliophthora roreri TaxID=221103 RepID=A0A0W0F670_MONRR|nr:proteophosphoglycan 5 [Moniliophthora roreri]
MSRCSTTATATYTLQKYSRSYPVASNTPSNEWQHFTNPVIRLVIDVQKTAGNKLESVRLRIIWSLETGLSTPNEVVFEDLDLLSFSTIPTHKPEGLPLKAVYRDTIVGIRYIHPQDGSPTATYRRFQVTFTSSSAVSQFIQSIESICPCKANNNNTVSVQPQRTLMNPATMMTPSRRITTNPHAQMMPPPMTPSQRPHASSDINPDRDISAVSSSFVTVPQHSSQNQGQQNPFIVSAYLEQHPSSQGQYSAFTAPTIPETAQHQQHSSHTQKQPSHERIQPPQSNSNLSMHIPSSSLPPSSLPDSSTSQSFSSSSISSSTDLILASLREQTKLYDLPPSKLEAIVAQVIREEGFVQLMESLSTMWRIKGYLGVV